MTIRPIIRFPDPRLRVAAQPVEAFDDALTALADDLLDTMRAAPGIGITAPHIGVGLRLVVIELDDGAGARVYVNPGILWSSTELRRHEEGSISMPGIGETIERPARVRVGYQDIGGTDQEIEADGLFSVCLQHEIDQLDGVFWIYRLSRLKREMIVKRYKRLVDQ